MPYPALSDHRIPYHRDGTRVAYGSPQDSATIDQVFGLGIAGYVGDADRAELNDSDFVSTGIGALNGGLNNSQIRTKPLWFFFPEQREITAYVAGAVQGGGTWQGDSRLDGSNDTTNGLDGTWETASFPSGRAEVYHWNVDSWRSTVRPISFTGPKRVIRWAFRQNNGAGSGINICLIHLYGEKAAGQTPDDILFIDDATNQEFGAVLDFGDRPLGTTVTRVFRLKNASTTKTANTVNLQCNDSDFAISTDGTTWVATINIASLAPGAQSSNLYVRCTTPAPGASLGPRFAELVVTVASWT
jgi:hypothetical protein